MIARLRHRLLMRRMAGPKLLRAFASAYPEATFVEVGANDGDQHDHLRPFISGSDWRGVMVEPVPYVFERLRHNYAGVDRVACENAAIADRDGTLPFFHLRDATPAERAELPSWYDGIGSFSLDFVLGHARDIPDVADRLVEASVPTLTFATLLQRHGIDDVDLVVIDTEGHDAAILRSIDLHVHRPRLLLYEHFHLSRDERSATRALVEAAGYETMEEGFDTFCVDPTSDPGFVAAWRRLRPAVAGVAAYAARDEAPRP